MAERSESIKKARFVAMTTDKQFGTGDIFRQSLFFFLLLNSLDFPSAGTSTSSSLVKRSKVPCPKGAPTSFSSKACVAWFYDYADQGTQVNDQDRISLEPLYSSSLWSKTAKNTD